MLPEEFMAMYPNRELGDRSLVDGEVTGFMGRGGGQIL